MGRQLVFTAFLLVTLCSWVKVSPDSKTPNEIQKALDYLNSVRAAPASFSEELGVNLSGVAPQSKLLWSDILGRVANAKALDMANRNYFAHVDPDGNGINIKISEAGYQLNAGFLSTKSQNNFESLSAGRADMLDAIKSLIIDQGVNPPGHRQHLLGIEPFWANCYDIGIGFAQNSASDYKTYCCVIIAKHDF